MCGVIGCFSASGKAADLLKSGLPYVQHRGQDAVGAFFVAEERCYHYRQTGLVAPFLESLPDVSATFSLGHCRYATVSDTNTIDCAQPLYTSEPCTVAIAHNGQFHCLVVPNNTAYDSWYFLSQCQAMLDRQRQPVSADLSTFLMDFSRFLAGWQGAFSVLLYIDTVGLIVFRDPKGIRPLAWAQRVSDGDQTIVFASESVVLSQMGFAASDIQSVERGTIHCLTPEGRHYCCQYHPPQVFSPCLFEYLYFSSPDSVFDGVSVADARRAIGHALAEHVKEVAPDFYCDCVISIPSSGNLFALAFAEAMSCAFVPALQLNTRKRSFLLFRPEDRQKTVEEKFSLDASLVAGRVVAVVDDALVRGVTSCHVLSLLRKAGVRSLIFLSASPPVRHINRYGIFIPTENELIAHDCATDELLCQKLGADAFYYTPMTRIQAALRRLYAHPIAPEVSSFIS